MSKITVKHYLNNKLKPEIEDKKEKYPVYVRVTHERKNLRFRSVICPNYYTEKEVLSSSTIKLLDYETEIINFIITKNLKNENESLVDVLELLNSQIKYFTDMIIYDRNIKDNLVKFISKKTKLDNEILNDIINVSYIDTVKVIKQLDTEIFENPVEKNKIIFYKGLIKYFESLENLLNIYEWKYKNGKENFITFFKNNTKNFDFKTEIEDIDNRIKLRENHLKGFL